MNENTKAVAPAAETAPPQQAKPAKDPVRKWTLIVLALCVVLLFWYLRSDRVTPFTSQARVHALVVPVAPEVSGTITSVEVANNQLVEAGQVLFRIDEERYGYAVQTAQATLDQAYQVAGAAIVENALRSDTAQGIEIFLTRK